MLSNIVSRFVLSTVVALVPALVSAATPTAYLERSHVVATGKQIKAYRVPTRDVDGRIRYRDITITIGVRDNGNPDAAPTLVSVASPNVRTNQFVPGDYTVFDDTCVVNHSILNGGRAQLNAECTYSTTPNKITFTWITGPVNGHPYQQELEAAQIKLVPGYQNFGWGIVNASSNLQWNCFGVSPQGKIIAASQVGETIQITLYGDDNSPDCGWTLSPATP